MAGSAECPVNISYRKAQHQQPVETPIDIKTLKDEIEKSQNILLDRLIQLEQKYKAATQQQIAPQHIIEKTLFDVHIRLAGDCL